MKKNLLLACLTAFLNVLLSGAQNSNVELPDSLNVILKAAESGDAKAQNEVGTWYYTGTHVQQDYDQAKAWWQKSALQGNIYGVGNLGLCYQYGRGVTQDSLTAARLYTRSIKDGNKKLLEDRAGFADRGSVFDQMLVASCFKDGIGTEKEMKKAMEYYAKAGNAGSVEAQKQVGVLLMNAREFEKAAKWFKLGLENEDIVSTYYYGKLLFDGRAGSQDKQQGIIYMLKAAENGLSAAQLEVGNLYQTGDGVAVSKEMATGWYRKAAMQNNTTAMWKLADNYRNGSGVSRNYETALFWYGEAAGKGLSKKIKSSMEEGTEDSFDKNFIAYLKGYKAYFIEKDFPTALSYFKSLKKNKIEEGAVMEAITLANASNPRSNAKKAVKMLTSAAKTNSAAMYYLATLYENGRGVKKADRELAQSLYEESAQEGYAAAQCLMGDRYYEGRGVEQSYENAVKYYMSALLQNQLTETATKRLAACYENGLGGLEKDAAKAKTLKERDFSNHVLELLKIL